MYNSDNNNYNNNNNNSDNNSFQLLTINTKCSILDVAAALDPPLNSLKSSVLFGFKVCDISYAWLFAGMWLADDTASIPRRFFNVLCVALLGVIPFSKFHFISSLTLGYIRLVSLGGIKRSASPK